MSKFRFIDLFAGVGGMRLAFEANGGQCVFTSEWDGFAQETYLANHRAARNHLLAGDITRLRVADIPDHDVLVGGFPCQPFSSAGIAKKNLLGIPHGFLDETQGTLFFDVARIIKAKRPVAFLLENVKNLLSHDKGRTFEVVQCTLCKLGYELHYKVIDAAHWVPQHRERIMIVGFRSPTRFSWDKLQYPELEPRLGEILHGRSGSERYIQAEGNRYYCHDTGKVQPKYTLSAHMWQYLQAHAAKHAALGNGFGYGLVKPDGIARTLSARYYKDGSEILVYQPRKPPRRLTPRECARLMGYPDTFRIVVSDTQAYKQFGNSVVVPAIAEVARIMKPHIRSLLRSST